MRRLLVIAALPLAALPLAAFANDLVRQAESRRIATVEKVRPAVVAVYSNNMDGGGSGVVPLMAMLRHRRRTMPELPMRLVYSVRNADDVIYGDELGDALLTYTREPPEGWSGHRGHIDPELIAEAGIDDGTAFVCGSNGFVETGSELLLDAGYEPQQIRTERFGPTG